MKPETVRALDRINRRFYSASGQEFSSTRQQPWPAWERVVGCFLATSAAGHAPHSILDVGCGNGRFFQFVEDRLEARTACLGVDASLTLAPIARGNEKELRAVVVADVVNQALPLEPRSSSFDLIVLFGVMHHVPSWERRRSLLVELAGHLARGGVLAVSFWQFGSQERFANRFVEWEELEADTPESIDPLDLENGDHLLRWGDGEAIRYCHWVDSVEAAELTAASGLRRLETFHGDGAGERLNLYHLLQRPPRNEETSAG